MPRFAHRPGGRSKGFKRKHSGAIVKASGRSNYSNALWQKKAPFGTKLKATLRYAEPTISLNPAATSAAAQYVFAANGLYDPNITGGGHQPIGWDQLIKMYDHAVVIGAKITCEVHNTDTTYPQTFAISLEDTANSEIDMRVIIENGMSKHCQLGPKGSSNDTKTVTWSVNPNKFLGNPSPLSNSSLFNTIGANPNEGAFFVLRAAPGQSTDASAVYCSVLIEYTVVFVEPKPLALS